MSIGTIEWEKSGKLTDINSIADIESTIREIEALNSDTPIGVMVIKTNGESLLFTVGDKNSFLNYYPKSYSHTGVGSYSSCTSKPLKGTFEFLFLGHYSEVALKNTIPMYSVLEVLDQFLKKVGMPNGIDWEMD